MSTIRTIVAGVSRPTAGDPALRAAAELARGCGAALHLVHAFEFPHLRALQDPGAPARRAAELRGELAQAAGGSTSPLCHAVQATPARAVLDVARLVSADLVVVGAGERRGTLGRTARRVLRHADVPVFVARRPVRRPLRHLLLATDLTEVSGTAHDRGMEAAGALFDVVLEARSLLVVGAGELPPPLRDEGLERTALEEVEDFLRSRATAPVVVEPVVRSGHPAAEIVAEAREWNADLLVLGTHGRVLLGSVARAAARQAPCNVLAVPGAPAASEQGAVAAAAALTPAGG